jgi:hypothetical protein
LLDVADFERDVVDADETRFARIGLIEIAHLCLPAGPCDAGSLYILMSKASCSRGRRTARRGEP